MEARRLGFFDIGFASAGTLSHGWHFQKWLAEGLHGEMTYLENQTPKRLNPELLLANVRSVLVLAMNYYAGNADDDSELRGKISRYAWGDDYHDVVKKRLKILLDYICSDKPSARGYCYVDTGPVMEKAWGMQTALGWMGKNTNLITRKYGSWFFIGVILLDTDLECDAAQRDFCGTCNRCITACPTGAIVAPYMLDARRCISYLTIELRAPIPRHLRPLMGNRIFGCDDCQEVCPWNRFAVRTSEVQLQPRKGNLMPKLVSLADLTPPEFENRFENSPIRRAKRDGFVRNVVVALGNSHAADAVPALERAMGDSSSLVRMHAAWGLGQIAVEQARQILAKAQSTETETSVLEEINLALENHR